MKRFIKWLKHILSCKCPDCGGDMETEMLDMVFDKLVYKCTKCGKEWI